MLARMQRKGSPPTLLVGMQAGAATLENSTEVPQKIENRATLQSSNCTTRDLPKDTKTLSKGYMYLNVYSNVIYNSQIMETAQVPINC